MIIIFKLNWFSRLIGIENNNLEYFIERLTDQSKSSSVPWWAVQPTMTIDGGRPRNSVPTIMSSMALIDTSDVGLLLQINSVAWGVSERYILT